MRALSAPMRVIWEITRQCNLRCAHCYYNALPDEQNQLSTGMVMAVVKEILNAEVMQVGISGGEPLLHPDCLNIIAALKEGGVSVSLNTNGQLVTPEVIEKLHQAAINNVTVSVDGARPETHDRFRGTKGAWLKAMGAIGRMAAAGIDVMANCVLHAGNIAEAIKLVQLIKDTGAGGIKFMRLYPIGRGEQEYAQHQLSFEDTTGIIAALLKEKEKHLPQFNVMFGDNLANAYLDGDGGGFESGQCEAGRYKCVIGADGVVRPCEFLIGEQFEAGSVLKESLLNIWRGSAVFKYFRSEALYSDCRVCAKKCPERCPACAVAGGNLKGPDPTCPVMLKLNQKRLRA